MSSWFKDFTDQVQSAIPKFDDGSLLQSLTLTTPELRAERERIDAEENRKEQIRNALSGMLPWQTRDVESDILVEECKDAILLLSSDKETFFGPFQLPPMKTKQSLDDTSDDNVIDGKPSKESLDKLAKLQPLPPLLEDFELLAHVGLIEKVLKEDPNLVYMQSSLSGGGAREQIFWKNYFFHCAYTRYEAGLSIDEIWSEVLKLEANNNRSSSLSAPIPIASTTSSEIHQDETEETITFDADHIEKSEIKKNESATNTAALFGQDTVTSTLTTTTTKHESDYEMIDDDKLLMDTSLNNDDNNTGAAVADGADYELDELEAEIARELED